MLDLIIPTMLAHNDFLDHYLPAYINNHHVNSIIIVDNSSTAWHNSISWLSHKIIHLPQKENIFVNASWNLGFQHTSSDFIMLLNDDVFISNKAIYDLVNFQWNGNPIICTNIKSKDISNNQKNHLMIENIDHDRSLPVIFTIGSVGHMMMMKRSTYIPIPEPLKIFFGDDFLLSKAESVHVATIPQMNGYCSKTISKLQNSTHFRAALQDDWIYAFYQLFYNVHSQRVFTYVGNGTINDLHVLLFLRSNEGVKYCALGVRVQNDALKDFEKALLSYAKNKCIFIMPPNGHIFLKYQYFKNPLNSNEDSIVKMLGCAKAWVERGIDQRHLFRDVIY